MRSVMSRSFRRDLQGLTKELQEQAREKFKLFMQDPLHASLRIKKMRGFDEIWEGHVTKSVVFTFEWREDDETGERIAYFRRIGSHDIYKKP